jgi:hypothetical protein
MREFLNFFQSIWFILKENDSESSFQGQIFGYIYAKSIKFNYKVLAFDNIVSISHHC